MAAYLLSEPDFKDKKKFNDKVALIAAHQFDGLNNGGSWRSWARNYFTSQAMEMDQLLKIVESSEDREVSTQALQAATSAWIHPGKVHALSWELWGFLNSNLTGKAKTKFDNVRHFEGFEAWRQTL